MSKKNGEGEKVSFIQRTAEFIVDKRKAFYLIYAGLVIFCIFSSSWVEVDNTLTDYLAENTETKKGLDAMEEEFVTYGSADLMVDNVSYAAAESIARQMEETEGVKEVEFDDTKEHFSNGSALFSITFTGEEDDPICEEALNNIRESLSEYDTYTTAELGDTRAKMIEKEMNVVMIVAVVIILSVLLFTSHTYMEIPVLVLTFGLAAILNKGTNFMLGTISFISNSIAIVLQLALAIDYAIILCHRYTEEREKFEPREAVVMALTKAIPEISGSSLTTLAGLATLTFMQFRIGYDMGIVLIKAILFSLISVFTFMPGLLMSFSGLIDNSHHKSFVPSIRVWGNIVVKLRNVTPVIFAAVLAAACVLSNLCPYVYSVNSLETSKKSDTQIAKEKIDSTFERTSTLAMLVPVKDYETEYALLNELEQFEEIDSVMGLANIEAMDGYTLTDKLTPRRFAELTDLDIEVARIVYAAYAADGGDYGKIVGGLDTYSVPLIDMFTFLYEQIEDGYVTLDDDMQKSLDDLHEQLEDAKRQLSGKHFDRFVLKLGIEEESEETFQFLDTLHETAAKYYGDEEVLLVGNATSNYDLSESFARDNIMISILSVLFVVIVLLFTFQSIGIPILLIIVIQGSIWINFSFPFLENNPMFFLSYLVVQSIQMGANIDYAIVITNRYTHLKEEMPLKTAIVQTLDESFPTIATSGTILLSAGFAIGLLSTDPTISSIGICLGRGTLISIILVMLILPQLLYLGDFIIEKTSFSLKRPSVIQTKSGSMKLSGHVAGYVEGYIDADFSGSLDGRIEAKVENGEIEEKGGDTDEDA